MADGENGPNCANTLIASGGGLLALDATDPKDQAMIRTAIARRPKRWRALSEEVKQTVVDDCVWARTQARETLARTDLPGAIDRVLSAAKTLTMIEGQNQKDEHVEAGTKHTHEHTHRLLPVREVQLPSELDQDGRLNCTPVVND